jgi:sugar phosphate isomerase/epimerase
MMKPGVTRRKFIQSTLAALPALSAVPSAAAPDRKLPFSKLGIITDEISQELDRALGFISEYSLEYCELREMWDKNIMNLSREQLTQAKQLVEKHHLKVSDIASPLYKYNLPEMPARANEKRDTFRASFTDDDTEDLLRRSFEIARLFGTNKVRIFTYWRVDDPEKAYPYVRDRLAKGAELAGKEGMVLVLENEPSCNVGTGKELGRLLRDIDSPHLRGNWDPANAVTLGEVAYPDGYREVRGLFDHMHVKDVVKDPATGEYRWMPVGSGSIDYLSQFRALLEDGYNNTISLETHYRRPDGNALESTRESLEGWLKILKKV